MPVYEFRCAVCDNQFEVLTSFGRISEVRCEKCGSDKLERLISMFSSRSSGGSQAHSSGCAGCASGRCSTCSN
jgi:putative FmdB family regulatory protein